MTHQSSGQEQYILSLMIPVTVSSALGLLSEILEFNKLSVTAPKLQTAKNTSGASVRSQQEIIPTLTYLC